MIQTGLSGVKFFQSIYLKDMNGKQEEFQEEPKTRKICPGYLKILASPIVGRS
jgi:hypothetical protein